MGDTEVLASTGGAASSDIASQGGEGGGALDVEEGLGSTPETPQVQEETPLATPPPDAGGPPAGAAGEEQPQAEMEIPSGSPIPDWAKPVLQDRTYAAVAPKLQQTFDRLAAHTSIFPTVHEAREYREAFPTVEDVKLAAQKATDLDEVNAQYESNDPVLHEELAEDWHERNPEGYPSIMRAGLQTLAAKNPQAYQRLGLELFLQTARNLYQNANEEARVQIDSLHRWVTGYGIGERAPLDPREEQYSQRETAIQGKLERAQGAMFRTFKNSVETEHFAYLDQQMKGLLKSALSNVKMGNWARERLENGILQDVQEKMQTDRNLQARLAAIRADALRQGDFTAEHRKQWRSAIDNRAVAYLRASVKQAVEDYTKKEVSANTADIAKRTNAAQRADITGGAAPNQGLPMLTREKARTMSNEEIHAWQGPVEER